MLAEKVVDEKGIIQQSKLMDSPDVKEGANPVEQYNEQGGWELLQMLMAPLHNCCLRQSLEW